MGEVWKKKFPNVIIPKNHRFSQCTTCAQLKSDLKAKSNFMSSNFSDQKKWDLLSEQVQNSKFHKRQYAFELIFIINIFVYLTHIFVVLFTEKKNSECKAPYGGT